MLPIAIFPAAGALGTSTYTHLLSFVPPSSHKDITLVSRDPSKTPQHLLQHGARTLQASYESPPSHLESCFRGSKILFLISYPSHVHEYRNKVQQPAIDAARRAGVTHVFYSSLGYAREKDHQSKAVVMQAHLDTEAYLAKLAAESGGAFSYTAIREGIYSESFPIYTGFWDIGDPTQMEIRIPHDGKGAGVAWVKRDELGEASARLIQSYAEAPEKFESKNEVLLLSGSRVWRLGETVKVLAEAAGRDVKLVPVTIEEDVKLPSNQKVFGKDELASTWSTAFDAIRAGECAVVTPTLKRILLKEPEAFNETIQKGGKFQDRG